MVEWISIQILVNFEMFKLSYFFSLIKWIKGVKLSVVNKRKFGPSFRTRKMNEEKIFINLS